MDLLRSPSYAVPLVINLTGSVWFFLLIGKAGELRLFLDLCKGVGVGLFGGLELEGEGRVKFGGRRGWTGRKAWRPGWFLGALRLQLLIRTVCRVESHGTDHKFVGIPIYGVGRMVGRGEGYIKGQALSC